MILSSIIPWLLNQVYFIKILCSCAIGEYPIHLDETNHSISHFILFLFHSFCLVGYNGILPNLDLISFLIMGGSNVDCCISYSPKILTLGGYYWDGMYHILYMMTQLAFNVRLGFHSPLLK